MPRLDAAASQLRAARFAERIVRHRAHDGGFVAEARERNRDVRLGAAAADFERRRLQQQLAARRGEPQQQLPKADESHPEDLRLGRELWRSFDSG